MTENQLKFLTYQEAKRHNEATESLGTNTLAETVRSNQTRESETERSNLAREAETYRHNYHTEVQGDYVTAASTVNQGTQAFKNIVEGVRGIAGLAAMLGI